MKKIYIIFLILLLTCIYLFPSSSRRGTTSANFLKLGFGARPGAMGEAFTAAADDISSIYYNPAGILNLKQKHNFSFMHIEWLENINYEWLSYILKVSDNQKIGFTFSYLNTGDIPRYSEESQGQYQDGTYSASDKLFIITYSTNVELFNKLIPFGINFKIIRQDIAEANSTGLAVDFGFLNKLNYTPLIYGVSVQNIGNMSKFKVDGDPLPWSARTGIKYSFHKYNLISAFDLIFPSDNDVYANLGFEYKVPISIPDIFIRSGITSGADNHARQAYSFGFGIGVNNFLFDYAYQPFEYFDDTHKISLTYNFGQIENLYNRRVDGVTINNGYNRRIEYYNPEAKEVKITGSFNNWDMSNNRLQKNGNGIWEIVLDDVPAGRYFYKLIVDNHFIVDPYNNEKAADGMGGKNSVLYINTGL